MTESEIQDRAVRDTHTIIDMAARNKVASGMIMFGLAATPFFPPVGIAAVFCGTTLSLRSYKHAHRVMDRFRAEVVAPRSA